MLKKFLEIRALHLFPATRKWAAKLVKNVSTSALRKVARAGTARAAMQMLFTTLRASVLTVISSVCVEAVVEIVRVCWPLWQRNKPRQAGMPDSTPSRVGVCTGTCTPRQRGHWLGLAALPCSCRGRRDSESPALAFMNERGLF